MTKNGKPLLSMCLLLTAVAVSVSIDCPDVISLATGLNFNIVNSTLMNGIKSDCCIAFGVFCTGNRVTTINWISLGLNGTINGTALPSALVRIDFSANSITGTIPTVFPSTLQTIIWFSNRLTGGISATFPPLLNYFHCSWNQLTGGIPATLPISIRSMYIHGNALSGAVTLWPSTLTDITIWGNQLTGDASLFPSSLNVLNFGNAGHFGNSFYGKIRLHKPTELWITNNFIMDLVVLDTSELTTCDLSNNPLLGNSNIANLTVCQKTNLFNLVTSRSVINSSKSTKEQLKITISMPPSIPPLFNSEYTSVELLSTSFSIINLEVNKFTSSTIRSKIHRIDSPRLGYADAPLFNLSILYLLKTFVHCLVDLILFIKIIIYFRKRSGPKKPTHYYTKSEESNSIWT